MAVIELKDIKKIYDDNLLILDNINLSIEKGQSIAILGKSGSGKSTLLHIAGLIDNQTSGSIFINDKDVSQLTNDELASLRNKTLGFVFQNHMLLEDFNCLENVIVPSLIYDNKKKESVKSAKALLEKVGLSDRLKHYPSQLSGGEKQRVSIARALINKPLLILADEPTGSLDEENAKLCENLLLDLVKKENTSLLLVTHNTDFANRCDQVYVLQNHNLNRIK